MQWINLNFVTGYDKLLDVIPYRVLITDASTQINKTYP